MELLPLRDKFMIRKLNIVLLLLIPFVQYAQVDYETDIQPIFNSSCIGCHSGPSPSAGIDLTNYESVLASGTIIEGDYENSLLWQVVESGYMPFGAPDLNDTDVNLITQWISELGGAELSCDIDFTPISPTSQSNSVAISPDLNNDLTIGMEIGLFSLNDADEYICSSTFTWEGIPSALAGFGAEFDSDGFISGGEMFFFALDDDGTIYELEVSYIDLPGFSTVWSSGGLSAINSISIINSLECGEVIEDTGCTDSTACNYNSSATEEDGSCIFVNNDCDVCFGNDEDGTGVLLDNDEDDDGICDWDEIVGCQDATACNYNVSATDDASCIFPVGCDTCSGETDGTGVVVDNDADGDGVCNDDEVLGCTDPLYEEFDPLATDDDGSCVTLSLDGCTDAAACNYNENATEDDGSCIYLEICDNCSNDGTYSIINNSDFENGLLEPCWDSNGDPMIVSSPFDTGLSVQVEGNFYIEQTFNEIPISNLQSASFDAYHPNDDTIMSIEWEYSDGTTGSSISESFIGEITIDLLPFLDENLSLTMIRIWGYSGGASGLPDITIWDNFNFCTTNFIDSYLCEYIEILGCTDENAFNYDPLANTDDESCCLISGCSDPTNIFYNPEACYFDSNLCITIEDCSDVIIPFATINDVSCYNESDGSIEVIFNSIFGGTEPYIVFWEGLSDSNGDGIDDTETVIFDPNNDGLLENLESGNYKITIIDNLGCTGTTIVSINQPLELNINYDGNDIECFGNESTINVGIDGNLMSYDIYINSVFNENVNGGSPLITSLDDFNYTNTGTNNGIFILGCDDGDCTDSNGIITPGDVIGVFYESSVTGLLECGGSATLGSIYPFGGLTAWQTEPGMDNGFVDGGTYIWYLYDTSGDIYELIPNYNLEDGLDYFSPGILTIINDFTIGTILGSNDDFSTSLSAGEYIIEIIGENGCSQTETIVISEPAELINSEETISNPTCSGAINGFININIEGGTGLYSYSWTGPLGDIISTSEDLSNLSPGTYSILVTDENDCTYTNSYEINNPEEIIIDYNFEPITCSGESTILNIDITGGESPYIIDYGGVDPNEIYSGFYTFSVTDNVGCLTVFDVSISDPAGIAIDYPAVETVCVGETNIPVDFSMSISGGVPPYLYEWFNEDDISLGIFSPNATVSPGNYSLVVSDEDGCESISYDFEISEPEEVEVTSEIIPINCFGETATANFSIDGAPGTYTIYFNDNTETTTIGLSDISFDFINTGTNHTILVSSIEDLVLNEGDLIGVFYTSGAGVQCGGSVTFNGTYPFTIPAWAEEPGEDNGFENGEEFLFLINSGGLVYEVNANFNFPDPTFSDDFEANGFSDVELTVTGVFSEGPDFSFDNLDEGNYFVEIVDGNDCSWSSTISIEGAVELSGYAEVETDATCSGELAYINLSVSGGVLPYNFQWLTVSTGELVSVLAQPELPPGNYIFIVTDDSGCVFSDNLIVEESLGDLELIVENESCSGASDGSVLACIDFSGDISFELWDGSGILEQIDITSTDSETCHLFTNLNSGLYDLNISSTDGCSLSEGISITDSEEILVSFSTSPAQCYNEASGQITINSIIGGNPPYEIDWEGVDTEAILPGYHSFIITDDSGCSKIFNYFIGQPANVNMNPSIQNNNCFEGSEGSISLNPTGGDPTYSYIWTNSDGLNIGFLNNINNLSSGLYTVQVTDSSGCVFIEEFEINDIVTEETVILLDTEIADCFGGFGAVSAEIFNQENSEFSFIWPDGTTNNGQEVLLQAGDYQLTVLHNISGCINTQNFTIQEPNEFIIEVEFEEISCFEDLNNDGLNDLTTSATTIIYGGADEDIDGDNVPNVLDNDIDGDGIVNILDDDIDGDGILNDDDDNGLIWINGDIDNDGIVNDEDSDWDGIEVNVDPNNLHPGIYYVYSYDSKGCYSITEFEIESPEELLVNATPNQILCFGEFGSAGLMISGGIPPYSIVWINQDNGDIVDPSFLEGGISSIDYLVEVTDQNGCVSTDLITINPEPQELLIENANISNYNGFGVSCNGDSDGFIDITVTGGTGSYTYYWTGPEGGMGTENAISNLLAGSYSVIITDENGCELTSMYEIIEPEVFDIIFTWVEDARCEDSNDGNIVITYNGGVPPLNYTINNSLEISGGIVNSNIITNTENIEDSNSILMENLTVGTYIIEIVSDQNNCINPVQEYLQVSYDDINCLWIPSVFSPNSDGVNDTFEIYGMEYYPNATVQIYNRWGQLVYESKNQLYTPWDGNCNINDMNFENEIATYYYVIELNTGQKTYNGSITLKR